MEPLDIEVRPVRDDEMAAAGEVTTAGYLS
jgi:hypothetical protein